MPHTIDTTGDRPDTAASAPVPIPTVTTSAPAEDGWVELGSRAQLRELLGEPWPIVIDKVHDRLTDDDLDILSRSPFCLLATSDAGGNCDVSPRGDTPGFTHVLDAGTLALPDRAGNRRGDSSTTSWTIRTPGCCTWSPAARRCSGSTAAPASSPTRPSSTP
ncbi:hypothetical protein STENM223S_00894 [Streptomyces tendae]